MFTIEQINDLHSRLGSARTFPEYVRALKALGVERFDSYLADGHSEYFGQGDYRVVSPPVHEVLPVAETDLDDLVPRESGREAVRGSSCAPGPCSPRRRPRSLSSRHSGE
jgi:hypothetical protein